jgi:limonene-1,2-epoxide hydrolase
LLLRLAVVFAVTGIISAVFGKRHHVALDDLVVVACSPCTLGRRAGNGRTSPEEVRPMAPNGGAEETIRGFAAALETRDLERAAGFFSTDSVYQNPHGEFKGIAEIRRYLKWLFESNSDLKIEPVGIGVLVAGNKAAFEHHVSGVYGGAKWQLLMICSYELSQGKIRRVVTLYDRLAMAKQVGKGWMAQKAVSAVIKGSEKGLR